MIVLRARWLACHAPQGRRILSICASISVSAATLKEARIKETGDGIGILGGWARRHKKHSTFPLSSLLSSEDDSPWSLPVEFDREAMCKIKPTRKVICEYCVRKASKSNRGDPGRALGRCRSRVKLLQLPLI